MNNLQHILNALKTLKSQKIAFLAASGLATTYFVYYTIKLYIKKRKYQHIPGPSPTNW